MSRPKLKPELAAGGIAVVVNYDLPPKRGWAGGVPTVRKTQIFIREAGKDRQLSIVLYPSGRIGFRLKGLQQEESITAEWAREQAIRARVVAAQPARKRKRK